MEFEGSTNNDVTKLVLNRINRVSELDLPLDPLHLPSVTLHIAMAHVGRQDDAKGYSSSDEKVEIASEEVRPEEVLPSVEELEEEKRLVRKLDKRILPFACLLYLFACELFFDLVGSRS